MRCAISPLAFIFDLISLVVLLLYYLVFIASALHAQQPWEFYAYHAKSLPKDFFSVGSTQEIAEDANMFGHCDILFDCFFLALLAGFIIVPAVRYFAQMKLLLPPGKKVGPSYWGVYDGSPLKEDATLCTIAVRQPTFTEVITAGSTVYSRGKPVKSLRR